MNVLLWIVTLVIAWVAIDAGQARLRKSKAQLVEGGMYWAEGANAKLLKVWGAVLIIVGVLLVVPPVLGMHPLWVPAAAIAATLLTIPGVIRNIWHRHLGLACVAAATGMLSLAVATLQAGPVLVLGRQIRMDSRLGSAKWSLG